MAKKAHILTAQISNDAIAQRAYELWQEEGCPDGRALEHWLRAEASLRSEPTRETTPRPRAASKVTTPNGRREKRLEMAL